MVVSPQLYISCRFAGFRLVPNHHFISLMTSKLIYKGVIYIAKKGSYIGFLSLLTVEDVSSSPPGSGSPPAAICASWGRYVIISELMLSMCWSHSLRLCRLCHSLKAKHDMSHTCMWHMKHISLTEMVLHIINLLARNIWFVLCHAFHKLKELKVLSYLNVAVGGWSEELVCL